MFSLPKLFPAVVSLLLILLSQLAAPARPHRIDEEGIRAVFNPQLESVVSPSEHSQSAELDPGVSIAGGLRQTRQAGSAKDFNGGVYWLSSGDGPELLQMWPAMGSYGAQLSQQPGPQPQQQGPGTGTAFNGGQQLIQQQQQQGAQAQPQQSYPQSSFPAAYGQMGGGGMPSPGAVSPYAAYLEKQISSYPVMIYTLADCIPCQRAKHLLAVHYPDVRAHYLELSGNEPWQQQLQIDLQYLTGAITFPYIFVCGQYIGGATELFDLHETGQLRRMVLQCLKPNPK